MSLQTGEEVPEAPASTRFVDKARFRWTKILKDPNPIWMRELRQSVRLTRTPWILMSVTIIATLLIASIGGSVSSTAASPDVVGQALYHSFFSLAYFVVACAGPALAANAIASEREGRTWEAVILTGLPSQMIARGKFLGAFTDIASYIVMLAPVGALSFLFGGVDSIEVILGFVYLFIIGLLSVAFGLAVSSKFTSSRSAILITLLLSLPLSGMIFGFFGFGFGALAHGLWERIPEGAPIWLPLAYVRGTFGVEYVMLLVVVPILGIGLPGWFLYESTIANLAEPNDDRSTGLKTWFLVAMVCLLVSALATLMIPTTWQGVCFVAVLDIVIILSFVVFGILTFMGEPLGASRRVRFQWDLAKASRLRRALGPGLERTFVMLGLSLGAAVALLVGVMLARSYSFTLNSYRLADRDDSIPALLRFLGYLIAFTVFCLGLGVWLRAKMLNLFGARLLFVVTIGGLFIIPWIVTAIIGVALKSDSALILGSPSPFFAFVLLSSTAKAEIVATGYIAIASYTGLGILLCLWAFKRSRSIVDNYDRHLARAAAMLDAEDAAARGAAQPDLPAST